MPLQFSFFYAIQRPTDLVLLLSASFHSYYLNWIVRILAFFPCLIDVQIFWEINAAQASYMSFYRFQNMQVGQAAFITL